MLPKERKLLYPCSLGRSGLRFHLIAPRLYSSHSLMLSSIMLDLSETTTAYLACGATDLRKSYHGLATIIKLKFNLDPYSRCMFAFCNRRRTSIKILQWDGSGFWILMKRLDRDRFHWPDTPDELKKVTLKEIRWLVSR